MRQIGRPVTLTVKSIKGTCGFGHKVGDQCHVSIHETGGICGTMYHDLFAKISMLQFGGQYPWQQDPDATIAECPDRANAVQVELRAGKPS